MRDAIIRVAIDGSSGSRRALDWALDEADLRGCPVELVSVYPPDGTSPDSDRRVAEAAVHAAMVDVLSRRSDVPVISWHVVAGDPADVLTRESEHSQMLVMGSHGTYGLRHSAARSVADLCTRTAHCPVVVVPPETPLRTGREDVAAQLGEHP